MRPIQTRRERERKETRNKIIIGVILVSLMLFSVIGYSFVSRTSEEEETEKQEYNGIEFISSSRGYWYFNLEYRDYEREFLVKYTPKDTENISVPVFKTLNNYFDKPLFFVGEGLGKQELVLNFQNTVLRMQNACIDETNCEEDLPIKNCSQDNIFIIKEDEKIGIKEDENCIFLSAPSEEQERAADALLFKILNI